MPTSNVRDTLGDFVNQYAGFAQTTNTLGLANGVPRQSLADPFPSSVNPVIEPYGQSYGRYTEPRKRREPRPVPAPAAGERPLQRVVPEGRSGRGTIVDLNYFFNYGTRVPFDKNLNMADPAFRYEHKTAAEHAGRQPFPELSDARQVSRRSCATPRRSRSAACSCRTRSTAPSRRRNTDGRQMRTQTLEIRAQRPFAKGISFLAAYAYNNEKRQEWFDDIAQYQVFTTGGGRAGNGGRPTLPAHRVTRRRHLADPGRPRARLPRRHAARRSTWRSAAGSTPRRRGITRAACCSSATATSWTATRRSPTRRDDRWFDTSVFRAAGLVHAAQQSVFLRRPHRPERVPDRHDADEELQSDEASTGSKRASRPTTPSTTSSGTTRTSISRARTSGRSRGNGSTGQGGRYRSARDSCSN